jgi:hypothetical protein
VKYRVVVTARAKADAVAAFRWSGTDTTGPRGLRPVSRASGPGPGLGPRREASPRATDVEVGCNA